MQSMDKALQQMGYADFLSVRTGKFFELEVKADDWELDRQIDEVCAKLLSNPVIENYKVEKPYSAYLIPCDQPKIEIIKTLFGDKGEKDQILLGDSGLAGFSLDRLPQEEQEARTSAPLTLAEEAKG